MNEVKNNHLTPEQAANLVSQAIEQNRPEDLAIIFDTLSTQADLNVEGDLYINPLETPWIKDLVTVALDGLSPSEGQAILEGLAKDLDQAKGNWTNRFAAKLSVNAFSETTTKPENMRLPIEIKSTYEVDFKDAREVTGTTTDKPVANNTPFLSDFYGFAPDHYFQYENFRHGHFSADGSYLVYKYGQQATYIDTNTGQAYATAKFNEENSLMIWEPGFPWKVTRLTEKEKTALTPDEQKQMFPNPENAKKLYSALQKSIANYEANPPKPGRTIEEQVANLNTNDRTDLQIDDIDFE